MIRARIVYYDESGKAIAVEMTGFVPFGDERFSALPLNDEYMRPLNYEQLAHAVDLETGEEISVREVCGARPLPGPITSSPARQPRPKGKKRSRGSELYKGQRRKDSDAFLCRYRQEIIWNHFRNRLIEAFNGRCYACGNPRGLQLDHHVPLINGGMRQPGNIVMLCFQCNAMKSDYDPSEFYSQAELEALSPLLAKQRQVITFEYDPERWSSNPAGYMRDIGISPLLIGEVMSNPNHPWAVSTSPPVGISISVGE